MRTLLIAAAFALGACAAGGGEPGGGDEWPFPIARGSALPPPAPAPARPGQPAPPEGAAAGGIDFGQWRHADPAAYGPAFQSQMRTRYAGRDIAYIRADLERNGFACQQGGRLDCRIEVMERQCAFDWYVVVEGVSAPAAGFDQMCLGAR